MIRWSRNIVIAIVVALLLCWLLYSVASSDNFSPVFPGILLLLGSIVTLAIWALGLTRFSHSRVRDRATIVLTYVEQAVRLNLPLTRMLIAAEASEPAWIARRISQLRKQLDNGSNIADALQASLPGITPRALALVAAAERVGQVGPELTRVVRHQQNQPRDIAERTFIRSYPVAMTIAIVAIVCLMMIFVMPKFAQLFRDFHVALPPLTQAVVAFTNLFDAIGWLTLTIGLTLLAGIAQHFRRRLYWLAPHRWFTTNRDLGDICHVIARELEANLPLDIAIRGASQLAIRKTMRRKLNRWADGIVSGSTPADAAYDADLPRLIAGLASTAEGFTFLSRYYTGKYSRLMILLRAAVIPAIVFFFGIIVAIVALTMFLPMVALIDGSNPYPS